MSLILSDCDVDLGDLIESKERIEQEIQHRVRTELAELDARRAALLALLGDEPYVPAEKTPKAPVVSFPKYRDPDTGKTWSGKGKRPRWFAVDRANDFLIAA